MNHLSALDGKALATIKGRRVLLLGSHPWSGHSGIVDGAYMTLMGWCLGVKLDNGHECGVFDPYNIKFLEQEMGK